MPDAAVRGFSPARFAVRSTLLPFHSGALTLLSTSGRRAVGACYSVAYRHSEEARVIALGCYGDDWHRILAAWEQLLELTCLRAAGHGKLRVLAHTEDGSPEEEAVARLGFTAVTRETVFVLKPPSQTFERRTALQPLQSTDVWDAWKLYSQTEPVTLQRSDGLTPASWWKGRRARRGPYREWILRSDSAIVLHEELLFGRRGAALRFHYQPAYRDALTPAVEHALALAGRRQLKALYCVAREHQQELAGLLQDFGFVTVRSQTRRVLYTSVLSYVHEAAALPVVERTSPALRSGLTRISTDPDARPGPYVERYNRWSKAG